MVTWDSTFQGVECRVVLMGQVQNLLRLHGQVQSLTQFSFSIEHPSLGPLRGAK